MKLKWLFGSTLRKGQALVLIAFLTVITTPYFAIAQCSTDLTTSVSTDNNQRGIMFNITATNSVLIQRINSALAGSSLATYEIYYKSGSYVGSETTAGDWTLAGSASINPNNLNPTINTIKDIPIDINVTIPAGQTYGFYITYTVTTHFTLYTNGSGAPTSIASDTDISISNGIGMDYPFIMAANNRNPRVRVDYRLSSTPVNTWTGSWSPSAPGAGACVLINGDYDVAGDGDINSGEIIVDAGVDLTMTSGAIQLTGNFTNNGNAFSQTGGTFTMSGSSQQEINGDNSFHTLVINNSSDVVLNDATSVTSNLTLQNGDLASDGNLTLTSTASETALVDNSGGNVTGNVTVQRFLDGGTQAGYRYISASIAGATVNTIVDDIPLTGLGTTFSPSNNGEFNLITPFPNFYKYDETLIQSGTVASGSFAGQSKNNAQYGWETPSANIDALVAGEGYALNVTSDLTTDMVGTLNTGDITLGLTHGGQTNSGWNLIGNPYPSPLDWDLVFNDGSNGATVVEGTIYVFDASSEYSGAYKTYNAGTGMSTDGGSEKIAQGQGFFVRSASGGGTLTFKNSHRLNANSGVNFYRTQKDKPELANTLRLALSDDADQSSEWLMYSLEGAEKGKDVYDAQAFLVETGNVPAIMSYVSSDQTILSNDELRVMDSRGIIGDELMSIPLRLLIRKAGTHQLEATELKGFADQHIEVILEDKETEQFIDLLAMNSYEFQAVEGDFANRFIVHLRPTRVTSLEEDLAQRGASIFAYQQQVHIQFSDLNAAKSSIRIYDLAGQEVYQQANQTDVKLQVSLQKQGIYIVQVENAQGITTQKVIIK